MDAAVQEMFSTVHMRLLERACRLDKLVLAALMLETRASGAPPRWRHRVHPTLPTMCMLETRANGARPRRAHRVHPIPTHPVHAGDAR